MSNKRAAGATSVNEDRASFADLFQQLSAGLESLSSSEYAETFISPPLDAYASTGKRFKNGRPKAVEEPAIPEKTSYESTYDVMTSAARASARRGPVSSIATQAAEAAHKRTNKRRMSVAASEAAAVAQAKAEDRAAVQSQMDIQAKRRFSLVAAEAAAAVPTVKPTATATVAAVNSIRTTRIALGDEIRWSSSNWRSEYDNRYKTPAYLSSLAKAAAAAQEAAITLSRKVGNCSEYLAQFNSAGDNAMPPRGDGRASFADQVGECLDFSINADKRLSNYTFNPRRFAWASEYASNFSTSDDQEHMGGNVTKVSPATTDAAKSCFDWIENVPSAAPEPDIDAVSEPFPSSTYSHDFLNFKSVRMPAPFKPATESQVEGCLDWDAMAAAPAAAAPSVTTTVNAENWVVVDATPPVPPPARPSNNAVVPGWGSVPSAEQFCSTYDWDFDGAWKKYTPSSNANRTRQKKQAKAKEEGVKAQADKAKARMAKIKKLAATKGVAKQSAAELYVAEKMLPFFATGSEYQKRYSVPAAVRQKAVAQIVKTQEKVAAGFRKPSGSAMKNNPILSGGRRFPTSVQNIPARTSYQSAFGSSRATSLKARIRRLAAQQA